MMTLLQCPVCKRVQYVPDEEYADNKKFHGHPYTCTCGDHIEILPVDKVEINRINIALVDKFDLRSGEQWVFQMYKQFGFPSFDNVLAFSKGDPNWIRKCVWTENCEDEFIQAVLEKNRSAAKRIGVIKIKKDFAWLSLDVGPAIILNS